MSFHMNRLLQKGLLVAISFTVIRMHPKVRYRPLALTIASNNMVKMATDPKNGCITSYAYKEPRNQVFAPNFKFLQANVCTRRSTPDGPSSRIKSSSLFSVPINKEDELNTASGVSV
jgi:hypothetical protein